MPGQVRSGHQRRFVDPTSENFAITPELEILTDQFFSLQVLVRVPVCAICISQNFYICDLRSGQIRDLYITSIWENIELPPASCKRVKITHLFQHYGRLSDPVTYPRVGPRGPRPLPERPQGAPQAPEYTFLTLDKTFYTRNKN